MDPKALDATTLRSSEKARDQASDELVVSLTIAWHADVTRVGDWCLLGSRTQVSRIEPDFAPVAGGAATPLGDPNLSRRPLEIAVNTGGEVELRVPREGSTVRIGDEAFTGARVVSRRRIRDGIVLTIADRVVLLLRKTIRPAASGVGHHLVGAGEALQWIAREAERVAAVDVPVLIRGATGTGKELVARAVHEHSSRAGKPFVAVNMTALAASTAASQLFGHQKGAFTGAATDHAGFFETASGGTLFLDEIGETPPEVQSMLLRTLESGELMRVGAAVATRVDVRVVAATDADLELAVAEERFRSPLLHRLAGYQISIPSLSARREDVGRLLLSFLRAELARVGAGDRLAVREPTEPMWLGARQAARLCGESWPGNVRQLRNVARRLAIACGDLERIPDAEVERALGAAAVAEATPDDRPRPPSEKRRPEDITDDELIAALRANAWRTTATATALGMSRTSLYARIERCPGVRVARSLAESEIQDALASANGDAAAAASVLEVSERGLVLRMKELGIARG